MGPPLLQHLLLLRQTCERESGSPEATTVKDESAGLPVKALLLVWRCLVLDGANRRSPFRTVLLVGVAHCPASRTGCRTCLHIQAPSSEGLPRPSQPTQVSALIKHFLSFCIHFLRPGNVGFIYGHDPWMCYKTWIPDFRRSSASGSFSSDHSGYCSQKSHAAP